MPDRSACVPSLARVPGVAHPWARWFPGKKNFGDPMFEPDVFRKQMCCIEESTWDIVEIFRRPSQ